MLYMSSYSTANGIMQLTLTFKPGTNLDTAQVQEQNRVAIAEPRLPEEVRRQGITTTKQAGDFLMVVHLLRSEEHTSELQSLMRNSYAVFCLQKKKHKQQLNPTRKVMQLK